MLSLKRPVVCPAHRRACKYVRAFLPATPCRHSPHPSSFSELQADIASACRIVLPGRPVLDCVPRPHERICVSLYAAAHPSSLSVVRAGLGTCLFTAGIHLQA